MIAPKIARCPLPPFSLRKWIHEAISSSWARHRSGWREHEKNGSSVTIWWEDLPEKFWGYTCLSISKYLDFSPAASKNLEIPGKSNEKARLWSRDLLDFPLGLPGISRFFEAARLRSRYFAIQGYVKLQILFGRFFDHKITLEPKIFGL